MTTANQLPGAVDVLVIGAGNAAMCARRASKWLFGGNPRARARGSGGNSRFRAMAIRCVYDGIDDLRELMPDLAEQEIAGTFGTYAANSSSTTWAGSRSTLDGPDGSTLITNSRDTLLWMRGKGVRFQPIWGRQAFKVDEFWAGLRSRLGRRSGPGRESRQGLRRCRYSYRSKAVELIAENDRVTGVRVRRAGETVSISTRAVVLASGGFEANHEWRSRYLGPGWDFGPARQPLQHRHPHGAGYRRRSLVLGWERHAAEFGDFAVGDGFRDALTRFRSCSTPTASASSTRAPIPQFTPMRNTAA